MKKLFESIVNFQYKTVTALSLLFVLISLNYFFFTFEWMEYTKIVLLSFCGLTITALFFSGLWNYCKKDVVTDLDQIDHMIGTIETIFWFIAGIAFFSFIYYRITHPAL